MTCRLDGGGRPSVPRALPALRRAFRSAGVPVVTPASISVAPPARRRGHSDRPCWPPMARSRTRGSNQPAHRPDRRCRPGRVATVAPRCAASTTCRSIAALSAAIADDAAAARYDDELGDAEARPLRRVRTVVGAARAAIAARNGVEMVLWEAWQASASSTGGHPRRCRADRAGTGRPRPRRNARAVRSGRIIRRQPAQRQCHRLRRHIAALAVPSRLARASGAR